MTAICIDTNLFLELYGTAEDPEEIFADIGAVREHLVFPDIIFDEFLRNRSRVLDRIADDVRKRETGEVPLPSVIRKNPNIAALQRAGEEYNRVVGVLYADIRRMIVDPAVDPVARAFGDLARDPGVRVFRRTEELIARAHRRKLLGNPPKSPGTDTIGDELIWETLLLNLAEDLIFVTRDRMFYYHTAYLAEEYRERTGSNLTITDRISDVLKLVGRPPSPALVGFEGRE
ncbi:PIN domain-containing protein [Methanoculleus sp. 7T]|uniref:PIN domain-containing protein n=1 Tax=Methanoculleus sp. 7T TaxID=2937282 RepID=UPI0020BE75C2|nr:PIN domain-containing protein [Methanoculleus sp. 7T]MCK8519745.1 PIN domain-containing protein [Methanoculleus sp. 7T]